jgi:hypothetical protein
VQWEFFSVLPQVTRTKEPTVLCQTGVRGGLCSRQWIRSSVFRQLDLSYIYFSACCVLTALCCSCNKRIVITMSTKSTSSNDTPLKEVRAATVEEHEEKTKEALMKRVSGTRKEEEAARVEFRRAANRLHACKSRQRSKNFRSELKLEISQLKQDKEELERANAVLSGKIEILMSENQQLGLNHQMLVQQRGSAQSTVGSFPPMFQQQQALPMGFTPGMMQWPAHAGGSMGAMAGSGNRTWMG